MFSKSCLQLLSECAGASLPLGMPIPQSWVMQIIPPFLFSPISHLYTVISRPQLFYPTYMQHFIIFFNFLLLFSSIVCLLGWLFFLLLIRKCSVCNGISMQWKVFHRVSKISPRLKDTDNARKKPKKVLQVMTGCECLVHFSSDVLLGSKMQMQKLVGSQLLQIFLEMSKT